MGVTLLPLALKELHYAIHYANIFSPSFLAVNIPSQANCLVIVFATVAFRNSWLEHWHMKNYIVLCSIEGLIEALLTGF
jgi:hypothetical protein